MSWRRSASAIDWNVRPFIDGRYKSSESIEEFDNVDPATETVLCRYRVGNSADIDEAVRAARRRFEDGCWSNRSARERAEVLGKLADLIVAHKEELALLDTQEMGKPIQSALFDVGCLAPAFLRACAGFADKLFGASAPLTADSLSINTYEPRGVIGAIVPWNFPSLNAVVKFAPALAVGNAVVLKPSEISPSSALKLAELALHAGLPAGVLNVVPGLGSTVGAALALHRDVDLLSFTGSTITGRRVMELAGRSNGKPLLLECGGKNAHIVFDDINDLNRAAEATVRSVVWNQGQVCTAHTRLLVHVGIKDALLERVVHLARQYEPGDPLRESTVFGPLASPQQRNRVKQYIEGGLRAGAVAILRGIVRESDGCYVSPTIFDRVESRMAIAREEIFGPVLCIQHFTTDDEAVYLANDTEFGLAATVWTRDMGRAKRLARSIRAGSITIRTSGTEKAGAGMQLSHEPQKASGFGSELGLEGLKSYATLKSISFTGC